MSLLEERIFIHISRKLFSIMVRQHEKSEKDKNGFDASPNSNNLNSKYHKELIIMKKLIKWNKFRFFLQTDDFIVVLDAQARLLHFV